MPHVRPDHKAFIPVGVFVPKDLFRVGGNPSAESSFWLPTKKIKLQFFMTSLESPFTENLIQPSLISVEYVMENGTGRGPERCGHHLA